MFLDLVKKGESDTIEFKISFDKEAIETLTAFANTKGGTIIIGVQNNGKLCGTQLGKETLQNWTNQIKLHTAPSIVPDTSAIKVKNMTMVILRIIEYPVKPISCKGKYFKRIHNSNHQMSIHEISDLHLKTHHSSWDHYYDRILTNGQSHAITLGKLFVHQKVPKHHNMNLFLNRL